MGRRPPGLATLNPTKWVEILPHLCAWRGLHSMGDGSAEQSSFSASLSARKRIGRPGGFGRERTTKGFTPGFVPDVLTGTDRPGCSYRDPHCLPSHHATRLRAGASPHGPGRTISVRMRGEGAAARESGTAPVADPAPGRREARWAWNCPKRCRLNQVQPAGDLGPRQRAIRSIDGRAARRFAQGEATTTRNWQRWWSIGARGSAVSALTHGVARVTPSDAPHHKSSRRPWRRDAGASRLSWLTRSRKRTPSDGSATVSRMRRQPPCASSGLLSGPWARRPFWLLCRHRGSHEPSLPGKLRSSRLTLLERPIQPDASPSLLPPIQRAEDDGSALHSSACSPRRTTCFR